MNSYRLRRFISKSLLLLALPAVFWLFYNNEVNTHTHIAPDGYLIYHAHPYKRIPGESGPVKSHSHSPKEMFLLSLLWVAASTVVMVIFLVSVTRPFIRRMKISNAYREPARETYQVLNYHAPPLP